jgi:tyrosyl-tRNA synthetase
MDIETKMQIIKSEPVEEIITEEEMKNLLETNDKPIHYIGLELSGIPHIGHVFTAGKKINDFIKLGIKTNVLLADWHTMANNKLGGDWEKIKKLSKFYESLFKEFCPGVNIVLGSDLYHNNDEYWKLVLQISMRVTVARATRTLIIEGRNEKENLHTSQYLYPIMQTADISALNVDIVHAGIDQRKVNVLAKEKFKEMNLKNIIPVHHHLIPSLLEPPKLDADMEKEEIVAAMKMSKSKPGSAISILDTEEEIRKSLRNAWCPERKSDENPVLELVRYVIIPNLNTFHMERNIKYGGDKDYESYAQLKNDYDNGLVHPLDLKNASAEALIKIFSKIKNTVKDREKILNIVSQK